MLNQFFLFLLLLCVFPCRAQPVVTVESFNLLVLEKQLASRSQSFSDPSLCDPTLSWYQVPNLYPGFGATVQKYDQIDCTTYNYTVWFTSTWPEPFSEWEFQYGRLITNIRMPPNPDYMDGVSWQQNINLEPVVDPLYDNNDRWLWSTGGQSLIHESTLDRITNSANSTAYIFSTLSQSYSIDPNNPSQVISQGSVLSRIFYSPANPTTPPTITTSSQKSVYNKTSVLT